jgi:segregation and condensation protein A
MRLANRIEAEEHWEAAAPSEAEPGDDLVVRLDGYEGPLAVLLDLAQRQKVDLRHVSVLQLADQYLAFVEAARARDLSLAADYLVMASWLTYLKSRLLVPQPEAEGDEPTPDEMAAYLAFQLRRLDAMRRAGEALFALPQLGRDVFARGAGGLRTETTPDFRADLWGLLSAYAEARIRSAPPEARPAPPAVLSVEAARERLAAILPRLAEWCPLSEIDLAAPDLPPASVRASAFNAALEMARDGRAELRQDHAFSPLYVRGHRG